MRLRGLQVVLLLAAFLLATMMACSSIPDLTFADDGVELRDSGVVEGGTDAGFDGRGPDAEAEASQDSGRSDGGSCVLPPGATQCCGSVACVGVRCATQCDKCMTSCATSGVCCADRGGGGGGGSVQCRAKPDDC